MRYESGTRDFDAQDLQAQLPAYQQEIQAAEERVKRYPDAGPEARYLEEAKMQYAIADQYLKALQSGDRQRILQAKIAWEKQVKQSDSLAFDQYLFNNGILLHVPKGEVQGFSYLVSTYALRAVILLVPLLALLLSVLGFGVETGRGGTLKLLLQQPVARWRWIATKYGTVCLAALMLLGIGAVCSFIAASLMGGVGDLRYPLKVAESMPGAFALPGRRLEDPFLCSTSTMLLNYCLVILTELLFYGAFGMLLSVLCMRVGVAAVLGFGTLLLSLLVRRVSPLPEALERVPFFLNSGTWLFETRFSAALTLPAACAIYLVSAALCLALAILVFRKKDIKK